MSKFLDKPRIFLAALIFIHGALVPVAIAVTLAVFGFEDDLTIENQQTWTPIIGAQVSLLAVYFVFGSGNAYQRFALFLLGLMYVLASVVWAYSMLTSFPDPQYRVWIEELRATSIWLVLPAVSMGVALIPFRLLLGSIGRRNSEVPNVNQFRIADLLALMLLVAVAISWYRLVVSEQLRQMIDLEDTGISAALGALGAVGGAHLLLSQRHAWIGLVAVGTSLLAIYWIYGTVGWGLEWRPTAYHWTVFVATLYLVRAADYRLITRRPLGSSVSP
jgi:hypothetical protein